MDTNKGLELLEQGLDKLLHQDDWIAYLRFCAGFHRYSFGNALLIWAQCPSATQVAGFVTWKQKGRFVRKGEKRILILAPIVRKVEDETGETERRVAGFRSAYVFDVEQTDGPEIPERPDVCSVTGDDQGHRAVLQAACPFVVTTVSRNRLDGANGAFYHADGHIELADDLEPAHAVKTLVHEWAHGLLHHKQREVTDRRVKELEAESTAFVVCHALGLDTSSYSLGYIAVYEGEKTRETLRASGERIQKAADAILQALEQPQDCAQSA